MPMSCHIDFNGLNVSLNMIFRIIIPLLSVNFINYQLSSIGYFDNTEVAANAPPMCYIMYYQ